jgi:hypothetical protein
LKISERFYTHVGIAVESAQIFEMTFTVFIEFQKMVLNPNYRAKTGGMLLESAFKVPSKSLLKNLIEKGFISNELSNRIENLIEARHKLIHRWIHDEGWPDFGNELAEEKIIKHALNITVESRAIAATLANYLLKYASPEAADKNYEGYINSVKHFFILAGNEENNVT